MHAPPPEDHIDVTLKDILPPPPPLPNPEFIRKLAPPPPKPVVIVKPKPQPKPQPAPAPVSRAPAMESRLVVGTSGLPHPGYPTRARLMHMEGTVVISVSFDSSGKAVGAEIASTSGSGILDSSARSFILENWKNASFAGRTETVPIQFTLGQ